MHVRKWFLFIALAFVVLASACSQGGTYLAAWTGPIGGTGYRNEQGDRRDERDR